MADPVVAQDPAAYQKLARESKEIGPIVERYRAYKDALQELAKVQEMARVEEDPELREMAHEEARALEAKRDALDAEIPLLLIPKDPNDEKNVLLEIRAGTGGDEAALFAGDVFRMYQRYAERQGWKVDVVSISRSGQGGIKEVIAMVEGEPRLLQAALRERRPPRAARAGDRGLGPDPHLGHHRGRPPGGRGGRRQDRPQGHPDRHLLLVRPRRPERQHHLLGGADHPPPHGHRRLLPGREEPDQEPREGHEGAARAPLRGGARRAAEGDRERPQEPGRQRRPLARRSAPTTSRRAGSPTTGSASPSTASRRSSTGTSRRSSPASSPTARPRSSRPRPRPDLSPMTAAALLADAAATLAAAGVEAPEWDAERLLRHVLGWDRATLFANPGRVVPEPEAERFRALVAKARVPRAPAVHPGHAGLLEARVPRDARRPHPPPGDGAARRDEPGAPEGHRATGHRRRGHGLRLHRPLARRRASGRRGRTRPTSRSRPSRWRARTHGGSASKAA